MSDTSRPPRASPRGEPQPDPDQAEETLESAVTPSDVRALRAQVAELEDRWRRALADADNLRKRHAREIERLRGRERAEAARDWLPVLDDLERALQHAQSDPATIIDGVRAVLGEAGGVLSRLGYPRRDDLGARFDPARHEAVRSVPDADTPPGTVVQVLRPAYGEGEHQLRPASVVVSRDG